MCDALILHLFENLHFTVHLYVAKHSKFTAVNVITAQKDKPKFI